MGRDKVDLFARIRDDNRQLGLGIRALAGKYKVHRRTVREALACPVPAPRKRPSRESPLLESVAGLIDVMLREDLDAPRKQRVLRQISRPGSPPLTCVGLFKWQGNGCCRDR